MILSLLYKASREHVRLIMIDPKMLELSVYEGIPHLLAPVVTDMKQARQRAALVRRRDGAALQADVARSACATSPASTRRSRREEGRQAARPIRSRSTPDDAASRSTPLPLHRRRHRRARRPDDGRRQEGRGADRAARAEGARRRHPPDPRDAAAVGRRDHRPHQGEHPDAHRVPGRRARSTRARSSTRWAPRRCSGRATCCTCRPAPATRCACTARSSSDHEVHRVVEHLKSAGRAGVHRGHARRRRRGRRR